ncbi:MAG: helix-turn-helix domain-containing protein [Sandaracinaceae bacterium]|nr:helix-turn-helix domain-containing protein [Sandaracinaceae bacterium]
MVTTAAPTKGPDGRAGGRDGRTAVDLVVLDGFLASGFSVTLDVLATANVLAEALGEPAPFRWRTASLGGGPVRSSAGVLLEVDGDVEGADGDVWMVFGQGMASPERVLSDVARPDSRALSARLPAVQGRGATVAASCSSTFLLAEAGLLDGVTATTCWWLAPIFRARYPQVDLRMEAIVCAHERVATAGAAMAQLDLALAVVRRRAGHAIAHACARYLVIDDARSSQAPYLVLEHLSRHDEVVARAERWMSERLARPIELRDAARAAGVSERTLARRFVATTGLAPARFLRRLRIETAARLLATTDLSIARVAEEVGYDDERAFRRAFAREVRRSPAEHRRAHRTA